MTYQEFLQHNIDIFEKKKLEALTSKPRQLAYASRCNGMVSSFRLMLMIAKHNNIDGELITNVKDLL